MIEAEGFIFYDTQIGKEFDQTVFRVLITKENNANVSIEDCVKVTHIISPFLDVEEPMSGNYILEVSSAGIDRKLEKIRHYQLSTGKDVEIIDVDKNKYLGKLVKVEGQNIFIEDKSAGDIKIELSNIRKAKTTFKF